MYREWNVWELTEEEHILLDLISKSKNVFSKDEHDLGICDKMSHKIK